MSKNTAIKITKAMQHTLGNWTALNEDINNYNEKDLRTMLKYELVNERRSAVIRRLKQKIIGVHVKEFKEKLDKVGTEDGKSEKA